MRRLARDAIVAAVAKGRRSHMPRTRAFKSGKGQAILIPAELAYASTALDLEITRLGDLITIFPRASL
jgi:hypothetical protein